MSVSQEQKEQILSLLTEGSESSESIAEKFGVSKQTIAGFKAYLTKTGTNLSDSQDVVVDALETTFGLDRDLQLALRTNLEQLEPGLKVIDGGKEQTIQSGRIDITAEDQRGWIVVIELRAGTADRDAIGQVLSYMGDLSGSDRSIRGILIAGEFTPAPSPPRVRCRLWS